MKTSTSSGKKINNLHDLRLEKRKLRTILNYQTTELKEDLTKVFWPFQAADKFKGKLGNVLTDPKAIMAAQVAFTVVSKIMSNRHDHAKREKLKQEITEQLKEDAGLSGNSLQGLGFFQSQPILSKILGALLPSVSVIALQKGIAALLDQFGNNATKNGNAEKDTEEGKKP